VTERGSCRSCNAALSHVCADLGIAPIANDLIEADQLDRMEPYYPLRALVCERCLLVQVGEFESPGAIFSDYSYFSSFSTSWLAHCRAYVEAVSERFSIGAEHTVVEIASNDGYLLQYFRERGIPVLGIEPAENVAQAAIVKGIPTVVRFFGTEAARDLAQTSRADLLIGNNVLPHVPDLNDFVAGMSILLAERGLITIEFPHLARLIADGQFDTIYHEHFSYFSLTAAMSVFARHGLTIFDVEEIPTHGGSLRIYARHAADSTKPEQSSVTRLLEREAEAGLDALDTFTAFAERPPAMKRELLRLLIDLKESGSTVVGYGAPAKGITLLNYCGIGTDFLDYTVDKSPHKQGRYLPGVRIPIRAPDEIRRTRPDYVLILPWNLKDEIIEEMAFVHEWGGRFLVRAPHMTTI
jgi:hypothetical protein